MAKRDQASPPTPFNAALAGLAARLAEFRPGPALPAPAPAPPASHPLPARAVVRMERAGRGGRTVTVVEKLDLPPRQLEEWLGELKRALGCGGAVEGGALVLQGDTRERIARLLEARGVRKVKVG